jgi:hypothetical protein
VCTGEGLPKARNGRPKTRSRKLLIRLSNESGTSERSSHGPRRRLRGIGWCGREHLRDAFQQGQDRREDGGIYSGLPESEPRN